MKKAICPALILAAAMTIITFHPSFSKASDSNYEKAVDLRILGLFMGNGTSFELERAPSRAEGANMLVRLLGKDQEAKKLQLQHPFTDVPVWAEAQIGYMYQNGLTMGSGNSTFGAAETLTAQQYVTFVLRALGFSEKNGDFTGSSSLEKAVQIGLLTNSEASALKIKTPFLRDDLVGISYNALKTKLKSSSSTLLDKLVNSDKVVSKEASEILGLYTSEVSKELNGITEYTTAKSGNGYVVKNNSDFFKVLRKFIYLHETQVNLDISHYSGNALEDFKAACDRAVAAVSKITGVSDILKSWSYSSGSASFKLTLGYRYTKNEFQTMKQQAADTIYKARHIVLENIKPGMSDYDKELVIHNYVINTTQYDYDNYITGTLPESSYSSYGCLILGKAVCQGYSEAAKLLFDLSNIESMVVGGETSTLGSWQGHSWNIVKINGLYYHVDLTFDDPVSEKKENTLTYYHFNLPDTEMDKQYRWKKTDYPICTSLESNYYYKNGLVVNDITDFSKSVQKAVEQRKTQIVLKIKNYSDNEISDPSDIVFKSGDVSGFKYSINDKFGIISITNIKYW